MTLEKDRSLAVIFTDHDWCPRLLSLPAARAGITYQDLGMKKLKGHDLVSVVEHYPDAIRYLAVDEKP